MESRGAATVDALMSRLPATMAALPLFEARAYLAHRDAVKGPRPNATLEGPFWNLGEWQRRS